MEMILRRIDEGAGRPVDLDLLVDVSDGISVGLQWPPKMTTICPLGPSAVSPVIALRDYFGDEVQKHVDLGGCPFGAAAETADVAPPALISPTANPLTVEGSDS